MSEPQHDRDGPHPAEPARESPPAGETADRGDATIDPGPGSTLDAPEFQLGASLEPGDDAPTIISRAQRKQRADELLGAGLRGKRLAHFELLEPIGVGGMAAVIRAHDTQLDRPVALKILPPAMSRDEESLRRFQHEARAAAKLDHENIARVFYCGEDQGLHFIAFEFVEGENLRMQLERRGRIPVAEAIRCILQVAAGLHHAASRGVVHRDIKPSNIIITPTGRAKLVDMGLARSLGKIDSKLTQSGVTLGTFDYISPEQALEPREADVRSDIYSLGCTFYHMLTGQPPVPEGTAAKKLHHHQHVPPLDPRQLNPAIPDEVAAVLARMMAKDPKDRYQRPEHLVHHLLQLAQQLSVSTEPAEGMMLVDVPLPGPPRTRPVAVGIAAAVGLVILVGVIGSLPTSPPPDLQPIVVSPLPGNKQPAQADPIVEVGPKTTQNPEPVPPVAPLPRQVTVASTRELVDALKQPVAAIRLADKVYDLRLKKEGSGSDVPGLVLPGRELVIESANAATRPTLQLKYDATAKNQPWTALTVQSGNITFRNLKIEIDAAETATPMTALARLGGRIAFERCEFVQSGLPFYEPESAQLTSVLVSGKANEGNLGLPDITFDHCWFRGGHQAVAFTGSAHIVFSNCAFGPCTSLFHFQGPTFSDGVLELDHCTAMLENRSTVFLLSDGAIARMKVNNCLFSNPAGIPLEPSAGAVLLRQVGDGIGRFIRYETRSRNVYHNFRAFWVQGSTFRALNLAQFRQALATGSDDRSLTLPVNPWQLEKPLAVVAEQPEKAFQVRQDLIDLREFHNPRDRMIGAERCVWGEIYPAPLVPLKLRIVDPTFKQIERGIYPGLSQAIGDAQAGDTILIRSNRLTVQPIHLVDYPGTDLTIKPDEGYHPRLTLGPTADPDAAMFRLSDGKLHLENLELELPSPLAGQKQSLVVISGDAQVALDRCIVTLQENKDGPGPRALCSLSNPDDAMRKEPKRDPLAVPGLDLRSCLIRGEGNLLSVRGSQAFTVEMEDSLLVLDGSQVRITGRKEVPPANPAAQLKFNNVTAHLTDHLIWITACDSRPMPGLVPSQVSWAINSLFTAARDRNPMIVVEGLDSDEKTRRLMMWLDGRHNVYSGFGNLLEQRPKDNAVPLPQYDRSEWLKFVKKDDEPRFDRVAFTDWPPRAGEARFSRILPRQFKIATTHLLGCGADVDRLPVPRGDSDLGLNSPED